MSDLNKDGVTDISEAVVGGEEHMAAQKAHVEEVAAREAARQANLPPEDTKYPREYNAHTPWVDNNVVPEVSFVGTQYSYNTEAEALDRITEARNAHKQVFYMDPGNASYIKKLSDNDYRVTIED